MLEAQGRGQEVTIGTRVMPRQVALTSVRWVVSLHLLLVLAQLAAAVTFLSGSAGAYVVHATVGHALYLLGICQAIAVVGVRSARQNPLTRWIAAAVPVAEVLQIYLARSGLVAWHLTLGLLVWAGALAVWIRVFARPDPPVSGGGPGAGAGS
jgi:hypothetical protein